MTLTLRLVFLVVAALVAFLVVLGVHLGDLVDVRLLALSLFFAFIALVVP